MPGGLTVLEDLTPCVNNVWGCPHTEPKNLSHLSRRETSLSGWERVLVETGPVGYFGSDASHVNVVFYM